MGTIFSTTTLTMKMFVVFMVAIAAAAASKDELVNLAANDPKVMLGLFNMFQHDFQKHYSSSEKRMRLANFNKFVKRAAQYNAEEEDVTYGITLFADRTDAEVENMRGFNATGMDLQADEDDHDEVDPLTLLGSNHQSRYGGVKNQRNTNACWAFAATAVLEGHTSITNRRYTALSEQEVADCTSGSTVARGGFHNRALQAVQRTGHLTSAAHLPFTYRDGRSCNTRNPNALPFRITGVRRVNGDSGLGSALNSGPVAVGMGFDQRLSSYRGGIYVHRGCMSVQNHAVTAVGYASQYWIVRNSYGTTWGESGYGRFTRQFPNMCHISSYSFYITVQRNGKEE